MANPTRDIRDKKLSEITYGELLDSQQWTTTIENFPLLRIVEERTRHNIAVALNFLIRLFT
jgi:hypothetical protein